MEFTLKLLEQSTHTPEEIHVKDDRHSTHIFREQAPLFSILLYSKIAGTKKKKYQSSQPHISRALKVAACHPTLAPSTIHSLLIPCRGILAVGYRSHSSSWKTGHRRRGFGCGRSREFERVVLCYRIVISGFLLLAASV